MGLFDAFKIKDPRDQSDEDQKIVQFVRGKIDGWRNTNSRVANEAIWLTNTAYFCGFTGIYFDSQTKNFRPQTNTPAAVRRYRLDVNKIMPTVQNRLARLCKSVPKWDVKPNTGDEEDKDAARLAKVVLETLWDEKRLNQKRLQLMMYVQQCGHAYLKVVWDTTLGRTETIRTEKGYERVAEGDIRIDVVSPFEVFVDPLAKTFDEVTELIQVKVRPLSYFKMQFPEKGGAVKEEDLWITSANYDLRINSFNTNTGSMSTYSQMKESAIELSYYAKPTKEHPFGRHIITANGVKLKDDILPIDEIPFAKFDDIMVAGKYASESVITHLRPMQDQFNRNKSMRAAWVARLLAGKYIAARGHNLMAEALNDQSGEVVEYDPVPNAERPGPLDLPTIPNYSYNEDDALSRDINDISGINEASRGQMPSSSIPAIGMQLLVEQDDTRIGVMTESHEYSYADIGRIILKFVGEYYKTDRVLRIAGQNMGYTVQKFKGEDLKDNFDVNVIRGSTLPGSKVLKRQEIINLHQAGYFGNPQDPTVLANVLNQLEYGTLEGAWKRQSLVAAQIERGIEDIKQGIPPEVLEYDKHDIWIQELDNFRLSEKFAMLSDDKKQLLYNCMEEHLSYLQEMVAPQPSTTVGRPDLMHTTVAEQALQEMGEEGG